ncbi:hypothetical protein PFISCL1PPCAC_4745, partial [Pristionchus fissidentatus]
MKLLLALPLLGLVGCALGDVVSKSCANGRCIECVNGKCAESFSNKRSAEEDSSDTNCHDNGVYKTCTTCVNGDCKTEVTRHRRSIYGNYSTGGYGNYTYDRYGRSIHGNKSRGFANYTIDCVLHSDNSTSHCEICDYRGCRL